MKNSEMLRMELKKNIGGGKAPEMPMVEDTGVEKQEGASMDFSDYAADLQATDAATLTDMLLEVAGAYMTMEEFEAMMDDFQVGAAMVDEAAVNQPDLGDLFGGTEEAAY